MARINGLRNTRRGRRTFLLFAAALLAVAALQVGTSSAIVPADLVDTYADAGHVTPTDWFARGDTVYMRGGTAGSTRSWQFTVTDPTGALVHDSGCQVSDGSGNGFDTYVIAANAVLGAAAGYTETFTEWQPATDCTGGLARPARSHSFRVAQLYAFNNTTDQGNCGGATPGASWSAVPCANALTSFTTGSQIYVRVLGLEPGVVDVSTLWDKPSGVDCPNTGGSDRPDTNATDGRLDTAYPPVLPETGDNPAFCLTPTELGAWRLNLTGPATAAGGPTPRPGVQSVSLAAFTITAQQTPTVSTTIHTSGETAVTAVPVGTSVHDFVKVDGGSGNPVPTGNVTIDWFTNGGCTGSPVFTSVPFALNASGEVDASGFAFTVNTAGDRAFKAHYAGGGSYTAADGPCETLHVVDASVSIAPATDTNPVNTGHVLTITVTALNSTLNPGPHAANAILRSGPGTFPANDPSCTYTPNAGDMTASCTVTLTSTTTGTSVIGATSIVRVDTATQTNIAIARETNTAANTGAGGSGDATKYWADDAVTTVVRDASGNDITNTTVGGGAVVHDEATVAKTAGTPAAVPNPTGTVTFTLYDNGTCNGNVVATDPNEPLDASGTASSAPSRSRWRSGRTRISRTTTATRTTRPTTGHASRSTSTASRR